MLARALAAVAALTLMASGASAQDGVADTAHVDAVDTVAPARKDPTQRDFDSYRIRVGDVLSVYVWQHEDVSKEGLAVPGDGKIAFPPIGRIELLGKTIFEIGAEIRRRLVDDDFLTDPKVDVVVTKYAPRYVFLMGAVQGRVELPTHKNVRILELLATSGYLGNPTADWSNVTIYRKKDDGSLYPIPVSVTEILKQGASEKNVIVFEDDYVEVNQLEDLENPLARDHVYVLGKVRKPGRHPILTGRVSFTLTSLIALAGDFDEFANHSEIVVIRRTDTGRRRIVIDFDAIIEDKKPDFELMPDDLVYVAESFL